MRFHNKTNHLFTAFLALLTLVFTQGCTKEDLSECGVGIRFQYVNNTAGIDKFPSDVNRIDLYVFDNNGVYIGKYSDQGSHLDQNYVMTLPLTSGKYTFVAWGNMNSQLEASQMNNGVSMLTDGFLSLRRNSSIITSCPATLFHGAVYDVEVTTSVHGKQIVMIDLTKDTNHVCVIKKGLPLPVRGANTAFDCVITSSNGDYKFDNSLNNPPMLTYLAQQCSIQNGALVSDFDILRDLNDGSTGSRLIITHTPSSGPVEELLNTPLTPLLINARLSPLNPGNTGNLDTDDHYTLEVVFDYTYGTVTSITINGWAVVSGGGIIG